MKSIFKRKIYDSLLKWKNESKGSTALLIEGARRIGKTCVAETFAKKEFSKYALIDFSRVSEQTRKIFDDLFNLDSFFENLFLSLGIKKLPRGSLIIMDEIQFCPKARQAIKHLVADGRYFYIETGSLVSIKENTQDILIPSEEESISMFPMDYEEFLWACDLTFEAESIVEHFKNRKVFEDSAHRMLMKHYRTYLAVGGMPQAVSAYLETHDFYAVEKAKKEILNLYENDLIKIDNKYGTICHTVWEQMPAMLSNHSTRFVVSSVNQRADSVLFASTMEKLVESRMVLPVFKCNDPSGGYALTKDFGSFKLYFSDVGLFTSLVYSSLSDDKEDLYQKIVFDKLSLNLGMLYENVSAQSFYALGYEPFYYSWPQTKNEITKYYEIDFLVGKSTKTVPFEVKSRNVSSKESLEQFSCKFKKRVGEKYIVTVKNQKYEDNLTYLPFYMLFALTK